MSWTLWIFSTNSQVTSSPKQAQGPYLFPFRPQPWSLVVRTCLSLRMPGRTHLAVAFTVWNQHHTPWRRGPVLLQSGRKILWIEILEIINHPSLQVWVHYARKTNRSRNPQLILKVLATGLAVLLCCQIDWREICSYSSICTPLWKSRSRVANVFSESFTSTQSYSLPWSKMVKDMLKETVRSQESGSLKL